MDAGAYLRVRRRYSDAARVYAAAEGYWRSKMTFSWWPSSRVEWRNDLVNLWNLANFVDGAAHGEVSPNVIEEAQDLQEQYRETKATLRFRRSLYSALAGECAVLLGISLADDKRHPESIAALRRSIELLAPLVSDQWSLCQRSYLAAETRLGQEFHELGKDTDAIAHLQVACTNAREFLRVEPDNLDLLHDLSILLISEGVVSSGNGKISAAREATEVCRRMIALLPGGQDPRLNDYEKHLWVGLTNSAAALEGLGRESESDQLFAEAAIVLTRLLGRSRDGNLGMQVARSKYDFGWQLRNMGRIDRAVKTWTECRDLLDIVMTFRKDDADGRLFDRVGFWIRDAEHERLCMSNLSAGQLRK